MSFRIIIARIRLAVFCLAIASISALIVSPAAASAPETEITYVAAFAPEAATVVFETDQDAAEHTAEAATDQDAAEHTAETAADQDATTEHAVEDEAHDDGHGPLPPIWMILPFAIILIMIATGPLFFAKHWHRYYPHYSVGLGIFVAAYYIFVLGSAVPIQHAITEYLSFIALVASLFVAASGIYLSINVKGTPLNNVIVLFVASIVANVIATTGAAMLFIRAYMRLNKGRLKAYHIVFFIFLVANVGGALTPIGDPPLFLGFLRGVPFFWTFTHVWYIWLPATAMILAIFWFLDSKNKDESADPDPNKKMIEIQGAKSFGWVAVIIVSVFIDPNVFDWVPDLNAMFGLPFGIREIIMFAVAWLAYVTADKEALAKNDFHIEPIREVSWLFLGIFATMQPALQLISSFAADNASSLTVGMFYFGTGLLSGILDNAPTYLNFLAAAMGQYGLDVNSAADVRLFAEGVDLNGILSSIELQAISVAAVFFGAMSYIGNAPNFMVKAIAEANGVETPSFMSYIVKYSIPILLPVYVLIWLIFFSGWVV